MGKINQLDKSIYNRLSAGEVVENPASIVKELVENSIDAGATHIVVMIEAGGMETITVIDDGCGMEEDDLRLSIMPHATSKIETADDLETIATLGFRGEALASIASVSKLEIKSHYIEDDVAHFIKTEDGEIKEQGICALSSGTTITVSSLFYNTPARSKFLKPPKGEETNVTRLIHDLMLGNPDVSIKYICDGKTVCYTNGTGIENAICAAFGQTVCDNLIYFESSEKNYTLKGYVGRPASEGVQGNRNKQVFIVNGRVFEDANIPSVIQNAYGERLMKRTFPVVVLDIVMPFDEVDVNVHPQKKEVRFADKKRINGMIYNAVKTAVEKDEEERKQEWRLGDVLSDESQENIIYTLQRVFNVVNVDGRPIEGDASKEKIKELMDQYRLKERDILLAGSRDRVRKDAYISILTGLVPPEEINCVDELEEYHLPPEKSDEELMKDLPPELVGQIQNNLTKPTKAPETYIPKYVDEGEKKQEQETLQGLGNGSMLGAGEEEYEIRPKYRIVGQIFDTYIILQSGKKMILVDQHATHERVLYDRFMQEIKKNNVVASMVVPYEKKLSEEELDVFRKNRERLADLGIVTDIRRDYLIIKEIPAVLKSLDVDAFVYAFLDSDGEIDALGDISLVRNKIAKMACRSAIKGGEKLGQDEIDYVMNYFVQKGMPLQCPHGRPTMYVIDQTTIEKWFRRIV